MSPQTIATSPDPLISPEVVAFAREQAVEKYLPELVAWAKQVYPSATRFEVFTEDDPEIANDRHIVFELDVPLSVDQALEADRRWHEGCLRIEPYPVSCVFRKSVNLP